MSAGGRTSDNSQGLEPHLLLQGVDSAAAGLNIRVPR